MKPIEDVTACVSISARLLASLKSSRRRARRSTTTRRCEAEYRDISDFMRGYGLDNVEKIDEFLNPKILDSVDLFVFPDIGYGDMQRHLRRIGKAVWGHMGATTLELYRDQFLEILEGVGLPTIPSKTIVGLSALREHLKTVEDKWIKVNCFRANSETWHHLDYEHSEDYLDDLAVIFGGAKEIVLFVVQDNLKSDMEIGYDGWCIDGQFPQSSFQGYEKKNELYLGSELSYEDLPDEIKTVNEAMAPVLKSFGYRGWWATEIRIKDGVPYFIDPTPRMPGQTGEHQLETCTNFAEVIWYGANGIVIPPEFRWRFAVEATLHFDGGAKHDQIVKEWRTLRIPKNVERWVKLYRYGKIDGVYKFAPDMSGEPGVVIGAGNTVEAAIAHLKKNLKMLKDLPVHANVAGFASLLESVKEAAKHGIAFGGRIPEPEDIVTEMGDSL